MQILFPCAFAVLVKMTMITINYNNNNNNNNTNIEIYQGIQSSICAILRKYTTDHIK